MNDFSTARTARNSQQATPSTTTPSPTLGTALFLLTLGCAGMASPDACAADKKSNSRPTHAEVAAKRGDLKEIRGQIEALQKGVAASKDKRSDALDQLKAIEQQISVTQRGLHDLGEQRGKLQAVLGKLAAQSRDLEARLSDQHDQLERLVYRQYLQGNPDSLRLLLNGDNPSQTSRDLYYLSAIGRSRSQLLQGIESTLQQKRTLATDTKERAAELAAIEDRQKEQHEKTLAQREQRKAILATLSARIAEQQREIGNLKRDEKQLSQLVDRLAKAIAAKPAPRPEPVRSAPVPVTKDKDKLQTTTTPSAISNDATPEARSASVFAQLRGSLRLPVRGLVSNRFGTARQEGSTWKGLFIRAEQGSEVKAIANGQVVFSDWMRGFGNLLIIDHGGKYLSIYGNNEAVLKQSGDTVRSGDVIASVGNSGGNPESGLYFELRYQGQPLDPLKWVNLK